MTSSRSSPTDEELSAHLDGVGPPELGDRISADPNAQARLDELARTRDAVRSAPPAPLGDDVVDELVTNALATMAQPSRQQASGGPEPTAIGMPRSPSGEMGDEGEENRRRGFPPTWLVAASIAVLLAVGLGLVWNDTRGPSETFETASAGLDETSSGSDPAGSGRESGSDSDGVGMDPEVSTSPHESSGSDQPAPTASDGAAPTIVADAPVIDLGHHDDIATLRRTLVAGFPGESVSDDLSAGVDVSAEEVERCGFQSQLLLRGDAPAVAQGTARAGDEALLVYEFVVTPLQGPVEETVALVAADDSCRLVTAFVR